MKKNILFAIILILCACKSNKTGGDALVEQDSISTELNDNKISALTNRNIDDVEITGEVLHTRMTYFNFDSVKNLISFFEEIELKHEKIVFYKDEKSTVDRCILQIEKYRKGLCKFYPDTLVYKSLSYLGHGAAYIDDHRPGVDLTYAEWFMMLVAYYSPDITCLVNMQSPDHIVGVRNFGHEYNYNPCWSYLFVKRTKGYEVRAIGEDCSLITKLYQLEDRNHRKYYLCSNNVSESSFMHYLYTFDVYGELIEVKPECKIRFPNVQYDEIYFSPEHLEWSLCKLNKNTGKLVPVTERPLMKLELKGKESIFSSSFR